MQSILGTQFLNYQLTSCDGELASLAMAAKSRWVGWFSQLCTATQVCPYIRDMRPPLFPDPDAQNAASPHGEVTYPSGFLRGGKQLLPMPIWLPFRFIACMLSITLGISYVWGGIAVFQASHDFEAYLTLRPLDVKVNSHAYKAEPNL